MIIILTKSQSFKRKQTFTHQVQMLSPEVSPEEQLKQNQMMSACSQLSPYPFYQQPVSFPTEHTPPSPQNFWNNSGT